MAVKFANNASSTLASSISDTDTSLTLADASAFPSLSAEDWFPLTVVNGSGDIELMRVTARAGDALTVERGQEGTTAVAFVSGSKCELRITAAALADLAPSGGGGVQKYTTTIGNGTDTTFTITHDLGTYDVLIDFRPSNPISGESFTSPWEQPGVIAGGAVYKQWEAQNVDASSLIQIAEQTDLRTNNECFILVQLNGGPLPTDAINVTVIG